MTPSPLRSGLLTVAALCTGLALAPAPVLAAGYDTPILYSARHMGMAGTAISWVDDPSAMFHNPAGISGGNRRGSFMLSLSPLGGRIQATPSADAPSELTDFQISPFFLAGGSWRLNDRFTFGLGVFPVAGAGGGYSYSKELSSGATRETVDSARLSFIEVAPTVSVDLAPGLRLGLAARLTRVDFDRHVINKEGGTETPFIDLEMSGYNLAGYRVGLQYTYGDLDFGVVYRNRITAEVEATKNHGHDAFPDIAPEGSDAVVTGIPARDVEFAFILPSKLGAGVQWRATEALRVALDIEWVANSENQVTEISGIAFPGMGPPLEGPVAVPNPSRWMDSQTFRLGAAYAMGNAEFRGGYAYDTQATRKSLPSAFGTPPAPTHIGTAGFGYKVNDQLDFSVAGAYRNGSTTVTKEELAPGCPFCGKEGDYEINLFGAYLDLRYRFGAPAERTAPAVAFAPDGQ